MRKSPGAYDYEQCIFNFLNIFFFEGMSLATWDSTIA